MNVLAFGQILSLASKRLLLVSLGELYYMTAGIEDEMTVEESDACIHCLDI